MKTIIDKPRPNGHCATICPFLEGVMIAYYRGPECTNKQRLILQYWKDDKKVAQKEMYPKTGNAVLCPINNNVYGHEAVLIYSYFNDTDGYSMPKTPVARWQYCSNWVVGINFACDSDEFVLTNSWIFN
jgi:hypothetical protein